MEIAAADELYGIATRMDIERAVARLAREEREILSLHLVGGLGFHEISRIVGISMPSAYRRYRKALCAVRDYLGGAL